MKFRRKPTVIEAIQYDGSLESIPAIRDFMLVKHLTVLMRLGKNKLVIPTLEGDIYASPGDWIVKGVKGEFYPIKPDIFEQIYEKMED